jgi:hypothetical protein
LLLHKAWNNPSWEKLEKLEKLEFSGANSDLNEKNKNMPTPVLTFQSNMVAEPTLNLSQSSRQL